MSTVDISALWTDPASAFMPTGQFRMAYIPPPAELASVITTFYIFRSEEPIIRDVQPAGIGHLMFFLQGKGQARFMDGHVDDSHDVSLICPTNGAMQYIVKGPFHCFGCALSPVGWRSLTGWRPGSMMDELHNASNTLQQDCSTILIRLRAIDELVPPILDEFALTELGNQMVHDAAPYLSQCFAPVATTLEQRIAKVAEWLDADYSPRVDDLSTKLGLSDRQVQRFVTEYFGCSPKFLARKYRALRVAMALSDPSVSEAEKSMLYELFYDQSHMIRELRHFVGKTPAGLAQDDKGLLQMWLDPDNLREIKPRLPED